ncbi:hypothetical protein D3C74_434240 [compost metagenome]
MAQFGKFFLHDSNALFQTGYITFGCHTSFLKHSLDLFLNHSLELALFFIAPFQQTFNQSFGFTGRKFPALDQIIHGFLNFFFAYDSKSKP